jgi:6-phosphogluconolactonase
MSADESSSITVVVAADPQSLAREAARQFVELGKRAVADHGVFYVALSGGSTPRALFAELAEEPYSSQVDWERIQIFFSDERFVPPESEESNYHLANEMLLSKVPVPERFVHRVATIDITPERSAALYEEGIQRVFEVDLTEIPRFDVIMLGLGPDGHTASLFPGSAALSEEEHLVVPNFVEKFDSWRITFTYPLINAAKVVMFLSQGEEKAERVQQVLSGDSALPATQVRPSPGRVLWLLDDAAASTYRAGGAAVTAAPA